MPKNKKQRGAQKKGGGGEVSRPPTDDETSTADNWSTASILSEDASLCDSGSVVDEQDVEDNTEQENFEDRLSESIDGISSKSGPQRKNALEGLKKAFSQKYVAEFLEKRKETVTECLLRCVKKGKGDEQTIAAHCLSLLALQLGEELGSQYPDIYSALSTVLADNSANIKARTECASAISMICFFSRNDFEDSKTLMIALEDIFSRSYRRADGSFPPISPEASSLSNRCLGAWSLLLTTAPPYFVEHLTLTHLSKLGGILHASDTDLRITSGEAIALLYDLIRDVNQDFGEDDASTEALCILLKELSTESTKHIAKKDRRAQRSSFRDILHTVQDGEVPESFIKMGHESLKVEGWSERKQYDAFCQVLGSGINHHLQENIALRNFYNLGAPLPVGAKSIKKLSKLERNIHNNIANKARTKARARSRDKRSAVIGF